MSRLGRLLPDRYPNKDFFILDVSDAVPKDDMASMEHPIFSLAVKPDMRELKYKTANGEQLVIVPSGKGLATIMDKDILLYCISKLVNQLNRGAEISQTVELTAHEAIVATNWRTNKTSYQRFEDALDRLRGTTIKTNVKTGGEQEIEGLAGQSDGARHGAGRAASKARRITSAPDPSARSPACA
ncbi:replication initiator protein A [Aestuariivita sp.]|jgi:plasmid replication initiation protein|uniref:replication initiator protein A n=1 Tax=Aestuariivita sp. TaxID=1872407 RepID=UPI00216E55A2|nr:replication initiator protein A [Aestuariivita sp.]MCE8005630.1 hypothetical protein [Aestuariivita sp.]